MFSSLCDCTNISFIPRNGTQKKGFMSLTDYPILHCQLLISPPMVHSCNMFDVLVSPNQSSEHLPKYFSYKTCSSRLDYLQKESYRKHLHLGIQFSIVLPNAADLFCDLEKKCFLFVSSLIPSLFCLLTC